MNTPLAGETFHEARNVAEPMMVGQTPFTAISDPGIGSHVVTGCALVKRADLARIEGLRNTFPSVTQEAARNAIEPKEAKPAKLRHKWKRFWSLRHREMFFVGTREAVKTSPFRACVVGQIPRDRYLYLPQYRRWFAPWKLVKTAETYAPKK